MAYTGPGIAASIALLNAVVFNIVAFVLPMWSTTSSGSYLADQVEDATFSAGVWGYCIKLDYVDSSSDEDTTRSFDSCWYFHTSSNMEIPSISSELPTDFGDTSVCDIYDGNAETNTTVTGLAALSSISERAFKNFLEQSCGSLGIATLVMESISVGAGVIAFTMLLLALTCCITKAMFTTVPQVLSVVAFVTSLLAFILWLVQSKSLSNSDPDNISLDASFIMTVISTVSYFATALLIARHSTFK